MGRFIECCCTSVEEVMEAVAGGARRVELCERLEVGGVTPSRELLVKVMECCPLPVNVLVRPRGGDFVFSAEEETQMAEDIAMCKELDVNGVVIGALLPDGSVAVEMMRRLIEAARPLSVTFHRAFDCCSDPHKALDEIISLGCDRLLTSGLEESAYDGRNLIASLVERAAGRLVVMPGGGVRPSNIDELEKVSAASEFHGSAHSKHGTTERSVVSMLVG